MKLENDKLKNYYTRLDDTILRPPGRPEDTSG